MTDDDQVVNDEKLIEEASHFLTKLVHHCAKRMNADSVGILLYHPDIQEFDLPIQYGMLDPETFLDPRLRSRPNGFVGKVVHTGTKITVFSVETDNYARNDAFARRELVKSFSAVPIYGKGNIIHGVLFVNYRQPNIISQSGTVDCAGIASGISESINLLSVLYALKRRRSRILEQIDVADSTYLERQALQTIAYLAEEQLAGYCLAVWLCDTNTTEVSANIAIGVGITHEYLDGAKVCKGDDSTISSVLENYQYEVASIIPTERSTPLANFATRACWVARCCYPIIVRGTAVGVLELLSFLPIESSFDPLCRSTAQRTAAILAVALENFDRSRESTLLREAAVEISGNPEVDQALDLVLYYAIRLTHSDYGAILLPTADIKATRVRRRVPKSDGKDPRDGYLEQRAEADISSRRTVLERVLDPILEIEMNAGSLFIAGVSIQIAGEPKGMLYVTSHRKTGFILHDAHLLNVLATQASIGLGWIRMLFNPLSDVEQATAQLMKGPSILETVCKSVLALGYDYVAIQCVLPEQGIIKTVYSCGLPADDSWVGRAGHYLSRDKALRDIQADLVLRAEDDLMPPLEAITGWDDRFDKYIYEHFHHEDLTRIFVPMIVLSMKSNTIDEDWESDIVCTDELDLPRRDKINPRQKSRRRVWRMNCGPTDPSDERYRLVIGTIEVGYNDPLRKRIISTDEAERLVKVAAHAAREIYKTTLTNVFSVILKGAMLIAGADAATFHFNWLDRSSPCSDRGPYAYQLAEGLTPSVFRDVTPRSEGLGRQAASANEPLYRPSPDAKDPDVEFRQHHPLLFEHGFRSSAAFPLTLPDKRDIVLYLHYHHNRLFTETEAQYANFFVNRAANAIELATNISGIQDQTAALEGLQSVTQTVTGAKRKLLEEVAWNTLNVIAADVVTIYEYANNRCLAEPATAGRLRYPERMKTAVGPLDAPMRVIDGGEPVWADIAANEPKLCPVRTPRNRKQPFVKREGIVSACAVQLIAANRTVGIAFVNFRRSRTFDPQTRHIIEILASTAALAISNERSHQHVKTMAYHSKPNLLMDHALTRIKSVVMELLSPDANRTENSEVKAKLLMIRDKADEGLRAFSSDTPMDRGVPRSFDAITMVQKLINVLRRQTRHDVAISLNLQKHKKLIVDSLESNIGEALSILIDNAIEELFEVIDSSLISSGNILVTVRLDRSSPMHHVCIDVDDNGRGVPEHIGDPFEHGTTGKNDLATRGMGLNYARFLVDQAGGTIVYTRLTTMGQPNVTRFTLCVPVRMSV